MSGRGSAKRLRQACIEDIAEEESEKEKGYGDKENEKRRQ